MKKFKGLWHKSSGWWQKTLATTDKPISYQVYKKSNLFSLKS